MASGIKAHESTHAGWNQKKLEKLAGPRMLGRMEIKPEPQREFSPVHGRSAKETQRPGTVNKVVKAVDSRGKIAQKLTARPSSSTESVIRKEFQKGRKGLTK